jgi:hypothetical protein
MTDKWQQTEEMAKRHEQGGAWLKLQNDGDRAVIVFLGEPHPREVCFVDGKYVPFDEKQKATGQKAVLRVAFNVALFETREVKVLEQGVMFFKDLVRVRDKYGLGKWAFEVERHGAAKDPKTSYSILPERQLTADEQREFQALELQDLDKLYSGETEADEPLDTYDRKAEEPKPAGPIDPKVAQALVASLKALPREAVDKFLKKFGVKRVKDLPAAQADKAKAFVKELVAAAAPASKEDVDPFA